ncbi:MAG: MFS transporter [Thermomicrobiales bacterium]|nr:MFS transporter [Thermomicrobiales bacterium]
MADTASVSLKSLFEKPGRASFMTATAIGRIPSAMRTLSCILLVQQLTGSYGLAGVVGATLTLVAAFFSPVLARLIDTRGERGVLIWSSIIHIVGVFLLIAAAYSDLPAWSMLIGAAVIGGSAVQFGSLSRARWVHELGRGRALERAYSLESMIDEGGFVIGPMLVVPLCLQVHPTAGILAATVFTLIGSALLLRSGDPNHVIAVSSPIVNGENRHGDSIIRIRSIQLIIVALLAMGYLFGSADIVIVAFAEDYGQPNAASYIAAVFAVGSLVGAAVYGMRQWPGSTRIKIVVTYWWIGLGTIPILLAPTPLLMAAAVFVCGLAISPGLIVSNLFVEQVAPQHKLTEAFAWLGSAMATGAAVGSIVAGYLIDEIGVRAGQWSAVAGGLICGLIATLGWKVLVTEEDAPTHH